MKRRCLVLMAGGGWYDETLRILDHLSPDELDFAYAYPIVGRDHSARALGVPHAGPWFPIRYLGYTKPARWRRCQAALNFVRAFLDAVRILRAWKPDTVFALGCASALPLFVVARFRGISTVFVESLTRSHELSTTGKVMHRLGIASRLFVQWPTLPARYPGTDYAGAVV